MTPPPKVPSGIVATQVRGRPIATVVGTLRARFSETARTIEPSSQAALVSGARTLNRARSWPLTIEVTEVSPRIVVPAAAARAAQAATRERALRARAMKLGAMLISATMKNDSVRYPATPTTWLSAPRWEWTISVTPPATRAAPPRIAARPANLSVIELSLCIVGFLTGTGFTVWQHGHRRGPALSPAAGRAPARPGSRVRPDVRLT